MLRKKILVFALLAVAAACRLVCACSEAGTLPPPEGLPADAAPVSEDRLGEMRLMRLSADTGETMVLLLDGTGAPVILATEGPTPAPADAEQTADEAVAAARAAFPDALVLQAAADGALRAVKVVTPCLAGTVWTGGGQICRRSLAGGRFIADGRLTLDGAFRAAQLLHPEAAFVSMEYEGEDGAYEGDALVDGVRYELELDARTGRLLEWERD